jgi:preprotein translocase subunit SecA
LSLEDPVMRIFAGDWVQNVLKQLGMKENVSIERKMVSRRIKQAQQKIEGRAFGSSEAESAERWLEKNCPELAGK